MPQALRNAIYGVVAALLALGVIVGWIDQDTEAKILSIVTELLGAVSLIVAWLYSRKGVTVITPGEQPSQGLPEPGSGESDARGEY